MTSCKPPVNAPEEATIEALDELNDAPFDDGAFLLAAVAW